MEADPFENEPMIVNADDSERSEVRAGLETVFRQLEISQVDLITFDQYKKRVETGQFHR
jgi:hypothetical protein